MTTRRPASFSAPRWRRLTAGRFAAAVGLAVALAVLALIAGLLLDTDVANHSRLRLLSLADIDSFRFRTYQLPRVLGGALVGGALAASGCTFQAVLRNPLAEPYALGISSGAALAAFVAIYLGIDQTFLGQSSIGLAALV